MASLPDQDIDLPEMGGLRARNRAIASAKQQSSAQAQAANEEAVNQFKKAGGVCLQGRGYTTG